MALTVGILTGATIAYQGATTLFNYNQSLWQFDKNQRQNRLYQAQGMAVDQVGLWRDDLRDLFDITNKKMDSYTMVSTLMVGFGVEMIINFHPEVSTPSWLWIASVIHTAACCGYCIMSMVFSMYASIVVQQFMTKTMTHIVRLPIPDANAIAQGSALGRQFEDVRSASNVKGMFRLPVTYTKGKAVHAHDSTKVAMGKVKEDPHIKMFQLMQDAWMPLSVFARVSMVSCLTHINYASMYMAIADYGTSGRHLFATCMITLILTVGNILMVKVDLMITRAEWLARYFVCVTPPFVAALLTVMSMAHHPNWGHYGGPFIYFFHSLWMILNLVDAAPSSEDGITGSKFRVTLLNEMQFPPSRAGVTEASAASIASSIATSNASFRTDMAEMSGVTTPLVDADISSLQTHEDPNAGLRQEVHKHYSQACKLLAQLKEGRGNFDHYDREIQALARWAQFTDEEMEPAVAASTRKPRTDSGGSDSDPPSEDSLGSGRNEKVSPRKTERMLKAELAAMRKKVGRLEEVDRKDAPQHRKNSISRLFKGTAGDDKVNADAKTINPIKQDMFDDCMSSAATEDLAILPWKVYKSFTSVVTVMFMLSTVWTLASAVVPSGLGRVREGHTTGRDQYLARRLGGGEYDDSGPSLTAAQSPRLPAALMREVPGEFSQACDVASWLRGLGHETLAETCRRRNVDGLTLRFLDESGWRELGVKDWDRSKLLALLRSHDKQAHPSWKAPI